MSALRGDGRPNAAGIAVKAFAAVIEADVDDHLANEFIEVDKRIGGDFHNRAKTKPVLMAVSQATRDIGSCSNRASKTASLIWSHILSGGLRLRTPR